MNFFHIYVHTPEHGRNLEENLLDILWRRMLDRSQKKILFIQSLSELL